MSVTIQRQPEDYLKVCKLCGCRLKLLIAKLGPLMGCPNCDWYIHI